MRSSFFQEADQSGGFDPVEGMDAEPLVQLGEDVLEVNEVDYGIGQVETDNHGQRSGDHIKKGRAQQGGEAGKPRLDESDDQEAQQPEGDRSRGVDSAVDVQRLVGIVPPPSIEEFLHYIRSQVLDRRGDDRRGEEDQKRVGETSQQMHDEERSGSVDRTVGAVEKAPVHEPSSLKEGKDDLPEPADDGVHHKPDPELGEVRPEKDACSVRRCGDKKVHISNIGMICFFGKCLGTKNRREPPPVLWQGC